MALVVPIITQFNGKGIAKARKEFAQLEGAGAKLGFVLKKSMLPAAAGLAAVGAAAFQAGQELMDMVGAAVDDQKAQKQLALSIRAVTKATDSQITAVEDYIDTTQRAVGVADDKLRPAYARLVRSTKDMQKAQGLLNLALDVSAATGKPLEAVANALGKAYDGQNTAIGRLGLGIDKATLKGMTFEELQTRLEKQFGGSAAEAADTYEGRMARLSIRFDELKEGIGQRLLPAFEQMAAIGIRLVDAFGIGGLAGAIQQLKFEIYSASPDNPFVRMLETIYNGIKAVHDATIQTARGISRMVATIPGGNFLFGKLPWGKKILDVAGGAEMPSWADMIGTPTSPLVNVAPGTTPGVAGPQGPGVRSSGMRAPITINVTSADPRAVVDALTRYNRQAGGIPVRIQQ